MDIEGSWKKRIDTIKELNEKREERTFDEFVTLQCFEGMGADRKILTHWITYVIDRRMKVKSEDKSKGLWSKALPVFSSWVNHYPSNGKELEKFFDKNEGFINIDTKERFKSRYFKKDFKNIKRTFDLLRSFDGSLVKFIVKQAKRFRNNEQIVGKIACCLFLLTYETGKQKDAEQLFSNLEDFEEYYKNDWKKTKTSNKKRLWAGYRDYIKKGTLQGIFLKALEELGETELMVEWKRFGSEFKYLNQLELPGDVWNNKPTFNKILLAPLALKLDIESFRLDNVSQVVREVCDKLNEKYNLEVYPEMLDFTWDDELRKSYLRDFKDKAIKIELED